MESNYLSDFLDGFNANYEFSHQFDNIIYQELPRFTYVLGQSVLVFLLWWSLAFSIKEARKRFKLEKKPFFQHFQAVWKCGKMGKFEVICTLLVSLIFSNMIIGKAIGTVQIYSQYQETASKTMEGDVSYLVMRKGGIKSRSAVILVAFFAEDGGMYTFNLINVNKNDAYALENGPLERPATLYLDKDGRPLRLDDRK